MPDPDFLKPALTAASLVTQLAVLSGAGAIAGHLLDERLHTAPWFLMALSLLGFTAGLYLLFQGIQRLQDHDEGPPDHPP